MSSVKKRTININGHRTSMSLEDEFWECFKLIAEAKGMTYGALAFQIKTECRGKNLCSAIRVYVLNNAAQAAYMQ